MATLFTNTMNLATLPARTSLGCLILLSHFAFAQQTKYPPVPAEEHRERFGAGIQRTMALLATSTPAQRHVVRILFYGQSITKQEWSQSVAQDLRARFPYADLTIENRAIGGYSSEFLIQTLPHDVYAFYPDLIIFHDFGGQENYEKIIAGIRQHTTAELLIQSDYPTWIPTPGEPIDEAKAKREEFHERHSFEWLPKLCEKYGCELIDVRRPWIEYLKQNKLKASAVLADGVHLNAQGNYLLAEITKRHLRYEPAFAQPTAKPLVRRVRVGDEARWNGGRLRLEFEGNRVELVAAKGAVYHAAAASILIDGKSPSAFPELYAITRPTDTYAVDWPSINRVTAEKPLQVEDWTLRVLETSPDDSQWRFEVIGSRTGPDGQGVSTERFLSKSGRVVIEPTDWGVSRAYKLRQQLTPVGFEVQWHVVPTFTDLYRAPRVTDPSQEYITVLASGLPPGRHTLDLVAQDKTEPPIREIVIYNPPVR